MITRCAWCERFSLGGQWLEDDEKPRFLPRDLDGAVTHGICPRCTAALKERGLSR